MKGGHTHRAPGIAQARTPLWCEITCGVCHQPFVGNAHSVPNYHGRGVCASCWRRVNLFRRQAGMNEWDTPDDAYPITPDEVHADPSERAEQRLTFPGAPERLHAGKRRKGRRGRGT